MAIPKRLIQYTTWRQQQRSKERAPSLPTVDPVVTGTPNEGETLTAAAATWPGSPVVTLVWTADGDVIPGETAATYVIQVGDEGKVIRNISVADYGPNRGIRGRASNAVLVEPP
jgi:hypothetical protein